MVFAANPEMWKSLYGEPELEKGEVVKFPTTEEEFEQMVREWEGLTDAAPGYSQLMSEYLDEQETDGALISDYYAQVEQPSE